MTEPEGTLADVDRLVDFGEGYLHWLESELLDYDHRDYHLLLKKMHTMKYHWKHPWDENRAEDGENLRVRYSAVCGIDYERSWLTWACSTLEMFDALAVKIDDMIMYDISQGERISQWFWLMLDNMGLLEFDDGRWGENPVECNRRVGNILETFMDRETDAKGRPTPFPMGRKLTEDWMSMDLWGQCTAYFRDVYKDVK